ARAYESSRQVREPASNAVRSWRYLRGEGACCGDVYYDEAAGIKRNGALISRRSAHWFANKEYRFLEKMHFTRMDQGSDEDFQILKRVHEKTLADLPDQLMAMVEDLSGDRAYNLDRRGHSLQAATRAMRDGADEELIVVALLHDIGESLGPMNHGEIAASILRPFVSSDHYNLLKYHGVFQTY